MHSKAQSGRDSQLQDLVARLTKEYVHTESDRRSVHRTPFVRPVTVRITGGEEKETIAFSKNISPAGIGLILEDAMPEGTVATLDIHTSKGKPVQIRSELRWCEPFGNGWHITGWRFITEVSG